jgi:hypothetical protein
MKHLFLFLFVCFSINESDAQCGKATTFKSEKGRDFKNDVIGKEVSLDATIKIDSQRIVLVISMNGETETLDCEIKEFIFCDWREYLQNGKTEYKVLAKIDEETLPSIITIESNNGYTTITFGSDPDDGSKLQLDVSSYTIAETVSEANPPVKGALKKKRSRKTNKSQSE